MAAKRNATGLALASNLQRTLNDEELVRFFFFNSFFLKKKSNFLTFFTEITCLQENPASSNISHFKHNTS